MNPIERKVSIMTDRTNFYGEAVGKAMELNLPLDEANNIILEGIESELQMHDDLTEWNLNHCMISAEDIGDILYPDNDDNDSIIQFCKKEVELLREYGYIEYADTVEESMNRQIQDFYDSLEY